MLRANVRLNILICMLVMGVAFLQYRLWIEPGGIRDVLQIRKQIALQTLQIEQLKKRNEVLKFQIARVKNENDGVESRARSELGMIKKGETFYQVIK